MRCLFVIFVLFFSIITIQAQLIEHPNKNGMIDNIKTVTPHSLKGNFLPPKLLLNFDKGKVYALPLDNMPCFVPNDIYINEHKYYKQYSPYNTIPNPYLKRDIIPGQSNGKISDIKIYPPLLKDNK